MLLTKPLICPQAPIFSSNPPKGPNSSPNSFALKPALTVRTSELRIPNPSLLPSDPVPDPRRYSLGVPTLHPALPRQDDLRQVWRRRHDVAGPPLLRRQRPHPPLVRRPPLRPCPRRWPRDQLLAPPPRPPAPLPQRPPRHRRRHQGRRRMVLVGKVNKSFVSLINLAGSTAVGLCGKDARLIAARLSPDVASLGFVGGVAKVDPAILRPIVADGHILVIASVAEDVSGQTYNVNADTAAGEIAPAIGEDELILLTEVAGILEYRNDPGSLVKEIDIAGVRRMVNEGKVAGGMIPKVNCWVRSLAQGVRTASIIDGRVPHSLLPEILTDEGAGTMIAG